MASHRILGTLVRRPVAAVRARLAEESGFALVLALVVVATLSIATASTITLVTSNETAVGRDRQEERAFNIAEAGLNEAISYLSTQNTLSISAVSPTNYSLDGGSGQWTATKTGSSSTVDTWTLESQATSGKSSRKVSVQLAANKTNVSSPASGVWGKGFFVADPNNCAILSGTSTVTISVYAAGNLCLNGNQQITEPTPTPTPRTVYVYVGGQLQLSGSNAAIGAPSAKVAEANIVGGCTMNGNAKICSNSGQSKVYADTSVAATQTMTKPAVNPAGIYAGGDWSHPVCSTGSFTFDGNTTRDTSVG